MFKILRLRRRMCTKPPTLTGPECEQEMKKWARIGIYAGITSGAIVIGNSAESESFRFTLPFGISNVGIHDIGGWLGGVFTYLSWPFVPVVVAVGSCAAVTRRAVHSHPSDNESQPIKRSNGF